MAETAARPDQRAAGSGAVIDVTDGALARRVGERRRAEARRRWAALAVLALVQLVLMLDATVVNIALPSIQRDLDVTDTRLAWMVNGYLLAFGGLLLLGGRLADLYGRRRVLMAGIALFSAASVVAGLAPDARLVVAMRFVQGVGAALAAPASLSLVSRIFTDPRERARALGLWGGISASGAMLGAVLSGVLTEYLTWRWVFLVTVPVTLVALALAPRVVPESDAPGEPHLDVPGAVLVTAGIGVAAHALLDHGDAGWGDPLLGARLLVAAILLLAFARRESRARHPLVPPSVFRHRNRAVGMSAALVLGAVMTAYYFTNTLYLQTVLGHGALSTAFAYLPFGVAILVAFPLATTLVVRLGLRAVMPLGLLLVAGGLALLAGIDAHGSYLADVLPGMVLLGVGAGFGFATFTVAGVEGTTDDDAGIASGVLNAGSQVGNVLGLATFVAVAVSVRVDATSSGSPVAEATVAGFAVTYGVAAAVVLVAAVGAAVLLRPPDRAGGPGAGSGRTSLPVRSAAP